ncbi:MAG TPA: NAD(P)H-hydrate dehydratase, partial [Isosphaeraceae bacterium]|nr:NAD(P)H-hydrate dehydratase [Isosphaeraceae bacterium]
LERVESIPRLPSRSSDAHKGQFGSILVVAGGRGMAGAAALVGASALRSGAGLVRVACPVEVQPTVASFEPSYMTYPLAIDEDGLISYARARSDLERCLEKADVVAVGPGLGQSEDLRKLVRWLVETVDRPAVVDADALNNLVDQDDVFTNLPAPRIITPHPGEFARLTGKTVAVIQGDREASAAEFAARSAGNLVVVLKGQKTVVTDGQKVYVNGSGNPGMATGGSGDCLTGVIAALLGQKLSPFDASVLGTYAHGLAGDIAKDQNGEVGMIAGDIVDSLADAFFHIGAA